MSEFIGVKSAVSLFYSASLKREALLFDKIAIPQLRDFLTKNRDSELIRQEIPTLEWLIEQGVLIETEPLHDSSLLDDEQFRENWKTYQDTFAEVSNFFAEYQRRLPADLMFGDVEKQIDRLTVYRNGMLSITEEAAELISLWEGLHERALLNSDYLARLVSIQLRMLDSLDAHPILDSDVSLMSDAEPTRTDVVDAVRGHLPVPDDSVAWEQILEYRSDPETRGKFLALKRWMNKISRERLPANEIEDELEFLMHEYEAHLKYHRMKINFETWQTIIVAQADLIPNLLKLKWGDVAKAFFAFGQRRIALMGLELSAPGNDVAYIAGAREAFPP
jgi:hypothetical protein